ncbi:hypothetical protein [Paenibacillus apii]|uniref:hypothetical protein n=1 Tax=Paenibacillus apii TaxID=1850370 RepID=UPI00143B80D4|nr:hypothetical protein [Paenibacillus apii]NJJ40909.1 hypothetical protein [Paenibacillus apii]
MMWTTATEKKPEQRIVLQMAKEQQMSRATDSFNRLQQDGTERDTVITPLLP